MVLKVGTERNLKFYSSHSSVTGIDYSEKILEEASKKARRTKCHSFSYGCRMHGISG
jgi:ubiquinone/menaquinone biosynthesis C-methylase UbiE